MRAGTARPAPARTARVKTQPKGKATGGRRPGLQPDYLTLPKASVVDHSEEAFGPDNDLEDDDRDAHDDIADQGRDPGFDDGDRSTPQRADGPCDELDGREGSTRHPHDPDIVFLVSNRKAVAQVQSVAPFAQPEMVRGIAQRDHLLQLLGDALAKAQQTFLLSLDRSDLVPVTGRELAGMVRGEGRSLSPATVSRLLQNTWAGLPDGSVIRLSGLLPDPNQIRLSKIVEALRMLDVVETADSGAVKVSRVAPLKTLLRELKRNHPSGYGERSVQETLRHFGIPGDPKRRMLYEQGRATWLSF